MAFTFAAAPSIPDGEWRFYGHDSGGARFSPLKQINTSNVSNLRRAWTYHMGELQRLPNASPDREPPAFECTPLMVDNALYISTPSGRVIALDAENGTKIWQFDSQKSSAPDSTSRRYHQHRGVSFWSGRVNGRQESRVLFGTLDGRLIALSAKTGTPCPDFGEGGSVQLRSPDPRWSAALFAITSAPAIYQDLVITGSRLQERPSLGPSGAVHAFDVRTGKQAWVFNTVPKPDEPGHETWTEDAWRDRSGTNVWSTISVDEQRGLLFLPVGSPAEDFRGDDRRGANLFGDSLVVLNARTGKLVWHYQMVHHDLWDYDVPAQPNLVVVRSGGRSVDAVAQVTKVGLIFLFDRVTGRPLFPIEERAVPQAAVAAQASWPTQPFPVKPPPLSRLSISEADLVDAPPESRQRCRDLFFTVTGKQVFTPLACENTLIIPGTLGGGNWSGASFDPRTGWLYVNVNEVPVIAALKCDESREAKERSGALKRYMRFTDARGRPCVQPPWGTLNAVNLNTGELVWKVPLGNDDTLGQLRKTGAPNLGGSFITAGDLVFIAATTDSKIRAFNARTGDELWSASLEAPGHAAPMTYRARNGKQYIVIAAGGGGYLSSNKTSDPLVAFALP
ncbi:MAG TPA: pyrroloquinoline quinone-dependent dehydrogenase [Acidobacteriota bacterium]